MRGSGVGGRRRGGEREGGRGKFFLARAACKAGGGGGKKRVRLRKMRENLENSQRLKAPFPSLESVFLCCQ